MSNFSYSLKLTVLRRFAENPVPCDGTPLVSFTNDSVSFSDFFRFNQAVFIASIASNSSTVVPFKKASASAMAFINSSVPTEYCEISRFFAKDTSSLKFIF